MNKVIFLFLMLFILPNTLLQKMGKVWHKYYGKNFSSNELIRQVLINEKIYEVVGPIDSKVRLEYLFCTGEMFLPNYEKNQ